MIWFSGKIVHDYSYTVYIFFSFVVIFILPCYFATAVVGVIGEMVIITSQFQKPGPPFTNMV